MNENGHPLEMLTRLIDGIICLIRKEPEHGREAIREAALDTVEISDIQLSLQDGRDHQVIGQRMPPLDGGFDRYVDDRQAYSVVEGQ